MTGVEPASDEGVRRPLGPMQERLRHQEALANLQKPVEAEPVAITSVRWGQTVNLGNYSSARLDVEAAVGTDGNPESTLEQLRAWVAAHVPPAPEQVDKLFHERQVLEDEIRHFSDEYQRAKSRWLETKQWMDKLGLVLPPTTIEDLPF